MDRKIPDFSGTWKMKSSENFEELLKALGKSLSVISAAGYRQCLHFTLLLGEKK